MPGRVVDASIFGSAYFAEDTAEEAFSLIGDFELFEPALLGYELANVARKKTVVNPQQAETIAFGLKSALEVKLRWVDVDYSEVLEIALQTGLTTYDASYVYVSKVVGAPLVTFDNKLRKATEKYLGPGGSVN